MVAQMLTKRSLMISRRMSTQVFNKITSMSEQPSELLSSMVQLKRAIGSLTSVPSTSKATGCEFNLNSGPSSLEDRIPWHETRKSSVETPQMCIQPSDVQDDAQAFAATTRTTRNESTGSDPTNKVIATAAFIAGLAIGSQMPSGLTRTQSDRLSIRSVD